VLAVHLFFFFVMELLHEAVHASSFAVLRQDRDYFPNTRFVEKTCKLQGNLHGVYTYFQLAESEDAVASNHFLWPPRSVQPLLHRLCNFLPVTRQYLLSLGGRTVYKKYVPPVGVAG
jgi:hypothetical protein